MKVHRPEESIRLKSYAIAATGLIVVLLGLLWLKEQSFHSKLMMFSFNVGLALLSVGLIALIWDIFGGDPITTLISQITAQQNQRSIGVNKVAIRTKDYDFGRWRELALGVPKTPSRKGRIARPSLAVAHCEERRQSAQPASRLQPGCG